jgi:soluble lytic murein transglycosylase-like protein
MRVSVILLVAVALAGWAARPAGAVPPPPPDVGAARPAACPLWYHPGEPAALYPHPERQPVEGGAALSPGGWPALVEARGWIEVGRPAEALEALGFASGGPAAHLYRLAALDEIGRWADLEAALEENQPEALPAACAPLHALWSARAASAAGRGVDADLAFERLAAALPDLDAWIDLLRLEAAALGGDIARGEAAWSRIDRSSLPSVAHADARRVLPELYARAGRYQPAVAWHLTIAGESRGLERAVHWLEAARLADLLGQTARADELRRRVVVHEAAHAADVVLDPDARRRLGIDPLEAAEALIAADRPAEAESFATAVLESGATVESRQRATLLRARARADRGDRGGAERDYAAFLATWPSDPRAPEAAFDRARLALGAPGGAVARERFESFLARWPDHPRADDALFLIGDSYHDDWNGDVALAERAIAAFDRLVAMRPGSYFADRAEIRAAQLAFALGRYAEAERRYRAYRGPAAREARYWTARALAARGQSDAARAIWRELANGGDEYYALLARDRLRGGPGLAALLPTGYGPAPEPAYVGSSDLVLTRPEGRTAAALLALGRRSWAQAELERALAAAAGDRPNRLAWAAALEAWEFPDLALRLAVGAPGGERYAFPAGFHASIDREARQHGLDGAWVMALIRQESMFRARVVSPVGARGLMQIMPRTGQEIATADGWPAYDPALLFHPTVSLHFGALYLEQQRARFDGFWPAVLAAYNGGPHNVAVWIEFQEREIDPELWVERIPYKETREYVRKIVGQWATYRRLYGAGRAAR